MLELNVNIKNNETSYPIIIKNDDISNIKTIIENKIGTNKYIVIFSEKVYKLYSNELKFPKNQVFILKDGEKEKNIKNYTKILDFVLSKKLTRQDYIIAIGGGVVGDIAGFAASTYMRGIKFIQIPTTLLACVDSSVGGKTAIDTKYGKNLVGAFYQPNYVLINANFLKTLDERQFKSGLGEVVKYGFIEKSCNPEAPAMLLNYLTEHSEKILSRDIMTMKELIKMCISLKISVVEKDEKENGLRKILNFGHTYGHAVENITKYKKFTHGECVVEGIHFALNLAFKLNLINKEYKFLCGDVLKKFNFKQIPQFDKNKIINIMTTDKKATQNKIIFELPTEYAQVKEYSFSPNELKTLF